MHRTLGLIGFLAGAAALCPAVARAGGGAAARGPVCLWTFDGSLKDQAGRARDGLTAHGPGGAAAVRFVTDADLPGTSGGAAALGVLPGDAQYLTAPPSAQTQLGPSYTIEAWIHPTHVGGWGRLVLNWGPAPRYAYHLAVHDGVLSLYHGQAGGKYVFAEGGGVQAGRWHHVAGVARRNSAAPQDSRLEVYLDGRLAATAPFDGTVARLASEGLGIGDSAGGPSPSCRYRGYIDEAALWDRALGAEEVRARYAKRAEVLHKLDAARRRAERAAHAEAFARLLTLGVEEIVFAERSPGRDPSGHYYANFGYSCIDPAYWIHGADGGRLCKLNVRSGQMTVLVDDPGGAVRDPQVHYDAQKVLFSYRKGGSHHYNLYEVNTDPSASLGAGGRGLRQITRGDWDDVEPAYLPAPGPAGGDIVFCSTRCKRYIGCWLAPSATLFRCDADGGNIRMLSSGAFTENTPAVLPDGRVLYTRWEYVNRDAVSFHHLWTMNPDGTGQMVYFGNTHPGGVFIDAKPLPGGDRVVLIHSPGHGRNEHAGHVAIVTDRHGPSATPAMAHLTRSADYRDPHPVSPDAFLVARANQVLLMDCSGRAEVLHTAAGMVHEPVPLVRHPRQRVLPSRADPSRASATLVLSDVYLGRNLRGVERGRIKKLLVLEDLPKPANYHGGGSQPIGHGVTSTLKRILGTVPVAPDGSACFEVPPLRSVYFAALDENDLSVKQMRSFVTLQPGETTGCVGCHESRTRAPAGGGSRVLAAVRRPPSRIQPIAEVPQILEFPRDVQPILDRHCVRCHNHELRKGGVVLAGDRGCVFSLSYYTLFLHWQVKDTGGSPGHGSGRQAGNDSPYSTFSSASALMEKIGGRHHDVRLAPQDRKMIRLWIDSGAQYPGTYAAYGTGQVGGCWGNNAPVRVMADAWPSTPPAREAIGRRCGSCHPSQQLPPHVTALTAADHGDMLSWTRPLSRFSRHRVFNLTRPEKSLVLLVPLARKAGGYAEGIPARRDGGVRPVREDRSRPPKPVTHAVVFADTGDADYRKILAHVQAAKAKLDEIRRFDMPGFRPSPHYVREMRRYGVLPPDLPDDAPIDVYRTDEAYWRSFWPVPAQPRSPEP